MSRLAQAGDSNTVSPGRATAAAALTAASIVAARSVVQTPRNADSTAAASLPISTACRTLPRTAAASGEKS